MHRRKEPQREAYLFAFLSIISVTETFDFQSGNTRSRDSLPKANLHISTLVRHVVSQEKDCSRRIRSLRRSKAHDVTSRTYNGRIQRSPPVCTHISQSLTSRLDRRLERLLKGRTQRVIRLQHHSQRRNVRRHDRRGIHVWQHDREAFAEDAKVGVHAPAGFLLRDDLCAARHEAHAGVVVVCEDGLDEVVGEVHGADGVAFGVADEDVGGGEVGREVELLPVGAMR